MASGSSATTQPADQARTTARLGGVMQEWRQWLAPGVVVAVVLAMGSLQRADMREFRAEAQANIQEFRAEVQADIQEFRAEVQADIQGINDRIDQVNNRIDRLDNRMDQVNIRIDRIYQLLLP